jgi:beta-mannosidase
VLTEQLKQWNRKASFYITKRALAKVVVGMERIATGKVPYMITSYPEIREKLEIWAVNGRLTPISALLKLSAFDIESGKAIELPETERERKVELVANQTTELTSLSIPAADTTVIVAYLDDAESSERLARWVSWPEPLKFVQFSKKPDVKAIVEGGEVLLTSNAPVKGVMVSVPIEEGGKDAVFEDNFVDVVPGEVVRLPVSGVNGRKLEVKWLCDWENEEGFVL